MEVLIIGAGMGGLTAALCLHAKGINVRVLEAAPEIKAVGVGINLLPHGTKVLEPFGLIPRLRELSVETKDAVFFDRYGKLIYREAMGLAGGFPYPQFSIHRGDLQLTLLKAFTARAGAGAVITGRRCTKVDHAAAKPSATFVDTLSGGNEETLSADVIIAADGVNSVVRKQFYPDEGLPVYSGINMWRGTTICQPFLSGASMVRAGSLEVGKMVIYPIRNNVDGKGGQLINWVAEIKTPEWLKNDWNRPGKLDDFFPHFQDWHFDWLDVAKMIQDAEMILEYPMCDRNPLPRWTHGRVTLLGDAAHPMYPRGSNGAAHAMLDAEKLAEELSAKPVDAALEAYEANRRPATEAVVLKNRTAPPDFIIETVHKLTGGKPFDNIDDVISQEELRQILANYQQVAGWDRNQLKGK